MTDTNTIRLSDRLELRERGDSYYGLHVDGEHRNSLNAATADALIEACNPPRLILPPGVEQRYVLEAETPCPDGWERLDEWGDVGKFGGLASAFQREVRPTTANPLPTLPATCWQIPDGRICCLRKDAQALRDMGWTMFFTSGGQPLAEWDTHEPGHVVEARPPAKPDTEWVPLHELIGRRLIALDRLIDRYAIINDGSGVAYDEMGASERFAVGADGQVEVLAR